MSDVLATPAPKRARLGYIDWLRGLAVLLMIQAHSIDAWLLPEARPGRLYRTSQFLAGAPAPLFLFLAGLALVLVITRMTERGATHAAVVRDSLRRGAQVVGYAVAFRLLAFVTSAFTDARSLLRADVLACIGLSMLAWAAFVFARRRRYAWFIAVALATMTLCLLVVLLLALALSGFADTRNLLRSDVLNCIGLSMLICAVLVFTLRGWRGRLISALLLTLAFCLLAPFAWDSLPATALPLPLYVYVSGRPPIAFFPVFPWAGYCSAGVAAGLVLVRSIERRQEGRTLRLLSGIGAALLALGFLAELGPRVYPHEDFWHTSPAFFWMRTGTVLMLLGLAYAWQRSSLSRWPSALRQMGRTSLLIYCVHVEIAYGNVFMSWARRKLTGGESLVGVVALTLLMLWLSLVRTNGWRLIPRRAAAAEARA